MNDSEIITSRDNAKLKFARAVRDGRESGQIFIEGIRLTGEAFRSDLSISLAFVSTEFAADTRYLQIAKMLHTTRVEPQLVAEKVFSSIADTDSSQGIVLLADRPNVSLDVIDPRIGPVVLMHQANNPSNLGAVVRTAEAAGVSGMITTPGSADAFSPKALRASMGSAFRLPIIERVDFEQVIQWASGRGISTIAADVSGATSYTDIDWKRPSMIVFGSEAHGLGESELAMIDEKIVIPMENEVESLNLAVSSGIVLFEAKRQRMAG